MKQKKYVYTTTYSFDASYVAKMYNTFEEAKAALKKELETEINVIRNESGVIPSVLRWSDDWITLVYAMGYTTQDKIGTDYASRGEDFVDYRIFEVEV